MFRKSHYIALGLVALLALVLLSLPGRTTGRMKQAIGGLFLPLFGLKSAAQQAAGVGAGANERLSTLTLENQSLRSENERLRRLVGWQQQSPWKMKLARVVLREPSNWARMVQIDVGTRDGVREDLPVVTPEGLVGRIASVGYTSSKVILLGDPNCNVAALVENETRDWGIVGASGPLDNSLVDMNFIPRTSNLKPGQEVVTSGAGNIFTKKGIRIGKIADVRQVQFGIYGEAKVKLAVNLGALEEVWVLLP